MSIYIYTTYAYTHTHTVLLNGTDYRPFLPLQKDLVDSAAILPEPA